MPLFSKTTIISAFAASMFVVGAQAAPFNALSGGLAATPAPEITQIHSYRGGGHAKLHKVLKPHYYRIFITRAMRAAAGNPHMVVFDRRAGGSPYRCSFMTYRGEKAMICD